MIDKSIAQILDDGPNIEDLDIIKGYIMALLDTINKLSSSPVTLKDFETVSNRLIDYQNAFRELSNCWLDSEDFDKVQAIKSKYNIKE